MTRIPKYRSIPRYAYKYAIRKGKLSPEHEKVFIKDPVVGVEYCVKIKRDRAIKNLEDAIFDFFCTNYSTNAHSIKNNIRLFFGYVHIAKPIPKNYENSLLNNLDLDNLVKYASVTEKRLGEDYENKLLDYAVTNKKLGNLVEYFCAIGTKLPENMHNFLLANALDEKNTLAKSYMCGLKNIKDNLIKVTANFDKNITIQELINSF